MYVCVLGGTLWKPQASVFYEKAEEFGGLRGADDSNGFRKRGLQSSHPLTANGACPLMWTMPPVDHASVSPLAGCDQRYGPVHSFPFFERGFLKKMLGPYFAGYTIQLHHYNNSLTGHDRMWSLLFYFCGCLA